MLAKQQQFYIFVEVKQHVNKTFILVCILVKNIHFPISLHNNSLPVDYVQNI